MDYLLLFVLGVCAGSFLNVVLYRLRTGDSPLRGRSYCDNCKKPIAWYDNIPLLSFLILSGKCRHCQRQIPIDYPIVEALTGIQFVWLYWLLKVNFNFFGRVEGFYSLALLAYWLVLFAGSLAIAVYDLKYMLIPDEILLPLIGLSLLRLPVSGQWQVVPVGIISAAFLWLLWKLTRGRGMGEGDIRLGLLMGLVLGWPQIIIAYFVAFLTGALWGVILIIARGKSLKTKVAFGPFLLLGMLIAKLFGWPIWQWYFKLL
ncbi:MAG TPA: prepilin peptidase [Patescibacteria group bacterium]|nr:prepilin peptidase [Patescibacteria group bacterium]